MSVLTGLRRAGRKAAAGIAAVAVATGMMTSVGTGAAVAANRDFLRADATGQCDWDQIGYWVQRCDVWSEAMGRNIPVQIQPSARGGNAGLYLLDGLRATNWANAWTVDVNAPAEYVDNNITLVMPVGGTASFYADWEGPATYNQANPVRYQWETFLTSELPTYLEQNFGVARNNNSVAGLSMGGTGAMNLAAKHPDQFRQVLSWSGYLTTSLPGWQTMLRLALWDAGGFNLNAMYGSIISPRRVENDPYFNMEGLRNTDVYVSAATGMWGPQDAAIPLGQKMSGTGLEILSRISTQMWAGKAAASGIKFTADYPVTGMHNWNNFGDQMRKTRGRILDVMNAW